MAEEVKKDEAQGTEEQGTAAAEGAKQQEDKKQETDYKAKYENLKVSFDKASSDVSRLKKELTERSTKEENERREREEEDARIREELNTLRTERRIGNYSAGLLGAIPNLSAESAKAIAEKLPEGVTDDFFSMLKAEIDTETARIKSEALNHQPKGTTGETPNSGGKDSADGKYREWLGL